MARRRLSSWDETGDLIGFSVDIIVQQDSGSDDYAPNATMTEMLTVKTEAIQSSLNTVMQGENFSASFSENLVNEVVHVAMEKEIFTDDEALNDFTASMEVAKAELLVEVVEVREEIGVPFFLDFHSPSRGFES